MERIELELKKLDDLYDGDKLKEAVLNYRQGLPEVPKETVLILDRVVLKNHLDDDDNKIGLLAYYEENPKGLGIYFPEDKRKVIFFYEASKGDAGSYDVYFFSDAMVRGAIKENGKGEDIGIKAVVNSEGRLSLTTYTQFHKDRPFN